MKNSNRILSSAQMRIKAGKAALALLVSAQMITMPVASYAQAVVATEPAQAPLIVSRTMASPNIMLSFDTSTSMVALSMPDGLSSAYATSQSVGSFHPDDYSSTNASYRGYIPATTYVYVGGDGLDDHGTPNNIANMRMRSPQINKIYYNPTISYKPWARADGSLMATPSPEAAPILAGTAGSPTVNLRGKNVEFKFGARNVTGGIPFARYYCRGSTDTTYNDVCNSTYGTGTFKFTPAVYFIYTPAENNPDYVSSNTTAERTLSNYRVVILEDIPASGITQAATRTDCARENADGTRQCTKEEEFQNFTNWYVFYRGRVRTAIGAMTHVFAKDYDMKYRLGWGTFTSYVAQQVRLYEGTHRTALYTWLYGLEQGMNTNTPTLQALNAIGTYYTDRTDGGPWSAEPGNVNNKTEHLACRKSFTILMTDGGWNGSRIYPTYGVNVNGPTHSKPDGTTYAYTPEYPYQNPNVTGMLADVAHYYWVTDLRPDLENMVPTSGPSSVSRTGDPAFWQHMVTHTVGYGTSGSLKDSDWDALVAGTTKWGAAVANDNWHAGVTGRGSYSSANNVDNLITSLGTVMESISVTNQPAPHVVLASGYLTAGNQVYGSTYVTGQWTGEFSAYALGNNGSVGAEIWKASNGIPAYADRNIWIGTGSANKVVEFKWGSLSPSMQTALSNENLVNYLRGDSSKATGGAAIYRERSSVLGDIVNSNPLVVKDATSLGYGSFSHTSGGSVYSEYHSNKANRAGMVFIGANDGMLHAFATDGVNAGKEVFAFIPNALLSKLPNLASLYYEKNHQYYVDGYLTLTDANLNKCNAVSCWRNILLGSAGAGGKTIFALDVTDPNAYAKTSTNTPSIGNIRNTVLWELTPDTAGSEMGYVMQSIQAGYTKTGDWVAVFGNGPYSTSGQAYLYVVNLKNGNIIQKIATDSTVGNGLMGVTLVKDSSQIIIGAYAGDLKGRIWYFDLSSQISASNWGSRKVFTTQNNRPITQAPTLYPHPNGGRMVLFGTGKFYDTGDTGDTGTDAIYGVWDRSHLTPKPAAVTYSDLLHRTWTQSGQYFTVTDATINWSTQRGWDLPLTMENGQRSLYTPQLIGTDVVFDTTLTTMNTDTGSLAESCDVGGVKGITIIANLFSGGLPSLKWDTNGDGVIDDQDGYYIGYRTNTSGPSYIGYNPGLGSSGNDPLAIACENGYVGASVGGVASCKEAYDSSTWTQLF